MFMFSPLPAATRSWDANLTWEQLFLAIAPYLQTIPTDAYVKDVLEKVAFARSSERSDGEDPVLDDQLFRTIALQLAALGLVTTEYAEAISGTMAVFWKITPKGSRLMIEQRTVKKKMQGDASSSGKSN